METQLREGRLEDAPELARICHAAFTEIAERHGFPSDIPAPEAALAFLQPMLAHPEMYGVVAEQGGKPVGSNFGDERTAIIGIGPLTVDPAVQDGGIGRKLMEALLARADERGAAGVRLVQSAYHSRSLALYARLGFEVREPLVVLQGEAPQELPGGCTVREATPADQVSCDDLCRRVHGHDRAGELRDAIQHGDPRVVERDGRVTGYTTGIGFVGHTVGETNTDLQALIARSSPFAGPGFLLPSRNGDLLRWCLGNGLRIGYCATLMARGLYNEPSGAFLPSILY
jgi:predicted N-acetyltransferase YhbS